MVFYSCFSILALINYLASNYITIGDIQSSSMFLLAMLRTPYLTTRIQSNLVTEHDYDPVLYAYACLLHRWRYFYKRTQILSKIDYNYQPSASFSPIMTTTTATTTHMKCSICLQPIFGQLFLCALCGHGGHLTHMHEWFSSGESAHKFCPDKGCTCRCLIRQQGLLGMHSVQIQQQPLQ